MFCSSCGTALGEGDAFCGTCGASVASMPNSPVSAVHARQSGASHTRQPSSPQAPSAVTATSKSLSPDGQPAHDFSPSTQSDLRMKLGAVGFVIGGLLGFVLRPSVFLIGQLPLGTVLTRGANLQGMDELLVPAAQSSFNLMIVVAIVGAAIGVGVAAFLGKTVAGQDAR